MYIIPNEAIQCDVLPCLAETGECVLNHSPQLAPGNLVRLDGSTTLTGRDMVDTIPDDPGWDPSAIDALSATLTEYADIFLLVQIGLWCMLSAPL